MTLSVRRRARSALWVAGLMTASLAPPDLVKHQRRRMAEALRDAVRAEHDVGDWQVGSWFVVVVEPGRPDWLLFLR